ncbi:hypothetical protein HPB49_000122 [Dermacentor silvarum]|uniref:Uncharacterized protein n=1 Tax=Dermacentor silvarum TaxID=543639 RepID=A0ACB8D1G6_DERSI|nr:hypothetical protein HPB49_000122 [Dermacentor silvarum]
MYIRKEWEPVQRRRPSKVRPLGSRAALPPLSRGSSRTGGQGRNQGGSMSSRLLACWLALAVALTLLLSEAQGAKGRGGKRGRGRMRSSGSARYIFYTHPKRKEYYDNPNGAQIEKASHFDYEFFLGHKIVFICVARGSILQISEWQLEGDRIKSKLEIDPARQMDSGNYECQADNKYAIDSRTFKADFSSLGS